MRRDQTFAEFQTTFLHLAGEAEIPHASLQMDLYDRITPALQRGIAPNLPRLHSYAELAADVASLDSELRRITVREERQRLKFKERQDLRITGPSSGLGSRPAPSSSSGSSSGHATIAVPSRTTLTLGIFRREPIPRIEPRRSASAEPPIKCFNCNKLGHISPNCPELKKSDLHKIEEEPYEP
jgi:hypothetical protein